MFSIYDIIHCLSDAKYKYAYKLHFNSEIDKLENILALCYQEPLTRIIEIVKGADIDPEVINLLEFPNKLENLRWLGWLLLSGVKYLSEILLNHHSASALHERRLMELIIADDDLKHIYSLVAIMKDDVELLKKTTNPRLFNVRAINNIHSQFPNLSCFHLFIIGHDAIKINAHAAEFGAEQLPMDNIRTFYYICCCGSLKLAQLCVKSGININQEVLDANPLIGACTSLNLELVKYLVSHGADVNSRVVSKNRILTPLIVAGFRSADEIIRYLVTAGADINVKNEYGDTVFARCADYLGLDVDKYPGDRVRTLKMIELVDFLLTYNPDINAGWKNYYNPLYSAVKGRRKSYVKLFLDLGADIDNPGRDGQTHLMLACENNDEMLVKYLILRGADIHRVSLKSENALHFAVKNRNVKLARLLIGLGIKIDLEGDNNVNSKYIHQWVTPLGLAIYNDDFPMVKFLLDHGADPNYWAKGNPPLNLTGIPDTRVYAVEKLSKRCTASYYKPCSNTKIVRYLIRKGAKIDGIENCLRHTNCQLSQIECLKNHWVSATVPPIFIMAKYERNIKKLKLLIKRGAKLNISNGSTGETPLMEASTNGNLAGIRVLIAHGADINACDKYKKTVLMKAVSNNHTKIVKYLLKRASPTGLSFGPTSLSSDKPVGRRSTKLSDESSSSGTGANINFQNDDGRTALMYAQGIEMIKLLVTYGADINIVDNRGQTLLSQAVALKSMDIIEYLVRSNVNLIIKDASGRIVSDLSNNERVRLVLNWISNDVIKLKFCPNLANIIKRYSWQLHYAEFGRGYN